MLIKYIDVFDTQICDLHEEISLNSRYLLCIVCNTVKDAKKVFWEYFSLANGIEGSN